MRERVQCIILKEKKILFVHDVSADHYYPPGGRIEEGESHEECIRRELEEEITVSLLDSTFYCSYEEMNVVYNEPQTEHNYFVRYEGEPQPSSEVDALVWVGWDDIVNQKYILPPSLFGELLKKLHVEGYL